MKRNNKKLDSKVPRYMVLCSSNSVENRVDVLLTEGGVMTKNFYALV